MYIALQVITINNFILYLRLFYILITSFFISLILFVMVQFDIMESSTNFTVEDANNIHEAVLADQARCLKKILSL